MHRCSNLSIKRHLKLKPIIHPSKSAWYRSYRIDPRNPRGPGTYSRIVQSPLMIDLWMEECPILMIFSYFHENGDKVLLAIRLQTSTKQFWESLFSYIS